MQELSRCIYGHFKRELQRKLLLTWGDRPRLQKTRALLQSFDPFARIAIHEAAWKDRSAIGDLVWRAFVSDKDMEMLEEE